MISFQEKVYPVRKSRKDTTKQKKSKFSNRVFQIVKKIPPERVLTYKDVAKLAGKPRAWRAVGNILNKNPYLKRIPCHRVIRSDGKVGGYKKGIKKKIALLKKEGITINYHNKITSWPSNKES